MQLRQPESFGKRIMNIQQQKITLVAALAENRVIGMNNDIPWHIPEDFAFFKQYTSHKPMIMGRNTWESLPRKPLPNRRNMVIDFEPVALSGAEVFTSLQAAFDACADEPEVIVMGGGQIYALALPFATDLRLTEIKLSPQGTVFFPEFSLTQWQEMSRQSHQSINGVAFDFVHYVRI